MIGLRFFVDVDGPEGFKLSEVEAWTEHLRCKYKDILSLVPAWTFGPSVNLTILELETSQILRNTMQMQALSSWQSWRLKCLAVVKRYVEEKHCYFTF
jgi:hypothetical protein